VFGVYEKCSLTDADEIRRQADGYIQDFSEMIGA
jgi:hypothetical protein